MTQPAWPSTAPELIASQRALAAATPNPWTPPDPPIAIGACVVVFPRGQSGRGTAGDLAWAAAAVLRRRRVLAEATIATTATGHYEPGLLALREGPALEAAVHALALAPDVLLVDATGRDHPRRAGLALHLGSVIGLPTVGVTHRPLLAHGPWPSQERGAHSPLLVDGAPVGAWLRTRRGARPLAIHPGWRTTLEVAIEVVLASTHGHRTPEPIRHARRLARVMRAANGNELATSALDK
ncbi:MAG TPA: endonuclease V [Solirubrobacteraceae bacterium]|nr:endonuclease V [Solirubrobacteraceae bacterium]